MVLTIRVNLLFLSWVSLGSLTMTKKMKELIPSFKDKDYQVLVVTGKGYYDDYKDVKTPNNVKIVPFMMLNI